MVQGGAWARASVCWHQGPDVALVASGDQCLDDALVVRVGHPHQGPDDGHDAVPVQVGEVGGLVVLVPGEENEDWFPGEPLSYEMAKQSGNWCKRELRRGMWRKDDLKREIDVQGEGFMLGQRIKHKLSN